MMKYTPLVRIEITPMTSAADADPSWSRRGGPTGGGGGGAPPPRRVSPTTPPPNPPPRAAAAGADPADNDPHKDLDQDLPAHAGRDGVDRPRHEPGEARE